MLSMRSNSHAGSCYVWFNGINFVIVILLGDDFLLVFAKFPRTFGHRLDMICSLLSGVFKN